MQYLIVVVAVLLSINIAHAGLEGMQGCENREYSSLCKVERLKVGLKTLSVKCDAKGSKADSHIKSHPYHAALLTQSNTGYMLDLIKTAKMKGRLIRVFYSCPSKHNPDGCKAENCRRLKGIGF